MGEKAPVQCRAHVMNSLIKMETGCCGQPRWCTACLPVKKRAFGHKCRRSRWTTSSEASASRLWNSQYISITIEQRLNHFLMSLHELGERFLHLCMQLSLIESQLHCLMRANCANQTSHIKSIFICTEGAGGLNTIEDIRETQTLLQQAASSILCSWKCWNDHFNHDKHMPLHKGTHNCHLDRLQW